MTDIKKLGKFEIRRELGKGAMGVVYEGWDPMIDRVVAIKTIRAENLQSEDAPEQLARFRREAQAAGRLTHPSIVAVYDFGEDAGTHYIAMEFIKGRELQDYLEKNERFPIPQVVRVMTQLLEALEHAHRNGVVHRDIKPSNIIILPDGVVKVADFGIARVESSNLTQAGMVLGTPSYMSPEQFMGQTVDGRSDLFSAGVILYQLLTGEKPFTGSLTTIMHKVLQEEPLPPSRLNVQVPLQFDALMKKALAKRPEERYQTAREFAEAIRRAAETPAGASAAAAEATMINITTEPTVRGMPAADATQRAMATQPMKAATEATQRTTFGKPPPPDTPVAPARKSQLPALAILGVVILAGLGGAAYLVLGGKSATNLATAPQPPATTPAAPPAPAQPAAPPASPTPAAAPAPSAAATQPGTVLVTALGVADPSDARYQADKAALRTDLVADSRSQAVEKALGLYLQRASLTQHYDKLREKLLAHSGDYIQSVVQESEPQLGKDGLMYVTTQAIVKTRDLQKSLNQMSRDERISFIRNNGDPKVAVRVATRDADQTDAAARQSPIAENILKERIKSFGFRTWSDDAAGPKNADFLVDGEARIKKLSAKLQASGLTITKFTLTSWTVKATDKATGEEIYFNTTLPKGIGSWASEEEALSAIGAKVADEFSKDFFLQHFGATGQKVVLKLNGLDDAALARVFERELIGLPAVLFVVPRAGAPRTYELQLAGGNGPQELVANGILKPMNAKLGKPCFALGGTAGDEVTVTVDGACADAIGKLETTPPAGLYEAPPGRIKSVVKNPETLKKFAI